MSLWQALAYFFREAARNLVRSWKTSLLAVLTITLSLFVGGLFLLITQNLALQAQRFSEEVLITVYYAEEASTEQRRSLRDLLVQPWVLGATEVSSTLARQRFEEAFRASPRCSVLLRKHCFQLRSRSRSSPIALRQPSLPPGSPKFGRVPRPK